MTAAGDTTEHQQARAGRCERRRDDVARARRTLPEDTIDPLTGDVDAVDQALAALNAGEPGDLEHWNRLNGATGALRIHAYAAFRDDPHLARPYQVLHDEAKDGLREALDMSAIARAGAPLCDVHGPMQHDGADWTCDTHTRCTHPYQWLDGSHIARRRLDR